MNKLNKWIKELETEVELCTPNSIRAKKYRKMIENAKEFDSLDIRTREYYQAKLELKRKK